MNNTLNKISGIKSIDFTIRATGEGIVNHNGSAAVWNPAAEKTVKNHLFPKLRGLDPMRKSVVNHSGEEKVRGLSLADPELAYWTHSGHLVFMAVLGGIGSIPGAMLGGVLLGLAETFAAAYISSQYKDIVAFSLLVLILLFRPTGLLGKPEVEKV